MKRLETVWKMVDIVGICFEHVGQRKPTEFQNHHKCGFRSRFMVGLAPNSSDTAVKLQHYQNMRFSIEVYGGSGTKMQ